MSFVPNRKLLQHNFDGYKLAPKHLSFSTKKLSTGVHVVHLKEQFSYQHVRTFSLHNHLFADPWSQNVVYWCSNDAIMAGEFYPLDGSLDVYPVFQLPAKSSLSHKFQAMNASLFHLDANWCLFSDGRDGLMLLDKSQKEGWKMITDFYLNSTLNQSSLLPFLILSAKLKMSENCFDLVTLDLQKGQDEKQSSIITIRWFSLTFSTPLAEVKNSVINHTIVLKHTFTSSCMPLYTALVDQSLFVVNEATLVSAGTEGRGHIQEDVQTGSHYGVGYKRKHEEESSSNKRSTSNSGWHWIQTDGDVTVTINLPHDITKHDIICMIEPKHLVVGLTDGTTYIRDNLYGNIDPNASAWSIEQHRLEINLEKEDPLGNWPKLLANVDVANIQQEDTSEQSKPIVTEEVLEECDLTDEDAVLIVYNSDGQLQYKAGLGGRQVLFSTTHPAGDVPPMFCVRHDIDALLWRPVSTPVAEEFPCQHIGTFNALGYVQASKRDKKFMTCNDNLTFAVICDCSRNVYVYLQPEEKATVALQFVHTMGRENSDILGLQATTTGLLFVLTNEELTVIKAIGTD